jgi:hypothetical protein
MKRRENKASFCSMHAKSLTSGIIAFGSIIAKVAK